jgi:hypothetical protein
MGGAIRLSGDEMKEYKKRELRRWWDRHHKGLSDLLSIIFFFAGATIFSIGVMLLFCAENISVIYLIFGGLGIFAACDLFEYGRR